mmetsp:Transcript_27941/g.71806  ORF Transcript_27941/g.71806 Transcript_27941/m.71806 type:complete len:181 (-) Transcript_27941:288-830(-)
MVGGLQINRAERSQQCRSRVQALVPLRLLLMVNSQTCVPGQRLSRAIWMIIQVLQNCSNTATLCWPNAHSPPSKYAPASHAYLLVLHKGSVTHSWQEISAAMHLPPGFCQHDFDPDSDEVGPAAGGKGLYSDVVLALVPQPQQSAASSNAFHGHAALHRCSPDPPPQQFQGGHAGLLQRA